MNKDRRTALNMLWRRLDTIKAKLDFSDIKTELESVRDEIETLNNEESDAYENLPEGLQSGERGEAMQEAMNEMASAFDNLETFISAFDEIDADKLDEIMSSLDNAENVGQ